MPQITWLKNRKKKLKIKKKKKKIKPMQYKYWWLWQINAMALCTMSHLFSFNLFAACCSCSTHIIKSHVTHYMVSTLYALRCYYKVTFQSVLIEPWPWICVCIITMFPYVGLFSYVLRTKHVMVTWNAGKILNCDLSTDLLK